MKNLGNQPGWPTCVANLQHCAGLPPHVGNTPTSNGSTKLAKLRHMAIFTRQTSGNSRNKAFGQTIYTEPTHPQLNLMQTHLTWPGEAELSNISDRQIATAPRQESKRIPYRNAAPAHNAPTLPAALVSGLHNLRHTAVVHRAGPPSTTQRLK